MELAAVAVEKSLQQAANAPQDSLSPTTAFVCVYNTVPRANMPDVMYDKLINDDNNFDMI